MCVCVCERESECVCVTGEPGESMTHMLFQTSVTVFFFSCYKRNCEESYGPFIMSVNGDQIELDLFSIAFHYSGHKHFLLSFMEERIINVRNNVRKSK